LVLANVTHFSDGGSTSRSARTCAASTASWSIRPARPPTSADELLTCIDALTYRRRPAAIVCFAIINPDFGYARQDPQGQAAHCPITASWSRTYHLVGRRSRARHGFSTPADPGPSTSRSNTLCHAVLIDELRVLGVRRRADRGGVALLRRCSDRALAFSKALGAGPGDHRQRRAAPNVSESHEHVGDVRVKRRWIVDRTSSTPRAL